MNKVKVIKQFGDIEINSELVYNSKYDTYEYANTNLDINKDYSYESNTFISLNKDVITSGKVS